jgi:putative SOS response-associated peptidase YedK
MCGRFALTATPDEVRRLFAFLDQPNFPGRDDIRPTEPIGVVVVRQGERRFELVRWGFVPGWVEDPREFSLLINARAETAAEKPSFRGAMRHGRCLVPADGFYEWRAEGAGPKRPYFISRADGGLVAFAGLTETWAGADGSEVDTAAILTVPANEVVAPIHDRMPELYRERAEVEEWKARCPIVTYEATLRERGMLDDPLRADMESRATQEVDDAVAFAEAGTWEPVETLTRHVVSEAGGDR